MNLQYDNGFLLIWRRKMAKARTLESDELQTVLDYIATTKHAARDRCALLVSHLSGMRIGEISSLTIADVQDGAGKVRSQVYLTPEKTKGKHARTVFINTRLQAEIAEYLKTLNITNKAHALFYTQKNPKRGFTANTMASHIKNIYLKSGNFGCSSHTGRRTFATQIAARGVSVRVLMRALGHRNLSSVMEYVDSSDSMLRNAVELA
jgi:integrase/recombinase XerD